MGGESGGGVLGSGPGGGVVGSGGGVVGSGSGGGSVGSGAPVSAGSGAAESFVPAGDRCGLGASVPTVAVAGADGVACAEAGDANSATAAIAAIAVAADAARCRRMCGRDRLTNCYLPIREKLLRRRAL